jgi:apolipoprotein N-acyltransferase
VNFFTILFSIFLGGVLSFTQAPYHVFWLVFITVPIIIHLLAECSARRWAFFIGWGFGFGYFLVTLCWIGDAFLVYEKSVWMYPFIIVLGPMLLAIYWGLVFAIFFWLAFCDRTKSREKSERNIQSYRHKKFRSWRNVDTLLFASLWMAGEYCRCKITFIGFPWALLGYVWIETPVSQILSIVGIHGLGWLTVVVSGLLYTGIQSLNRNRFSTGMKGKRIVFLYILIPIFSVGGFWIWGKWRVSSEDNIENQVERYLSVQIVQPNITQAEKWKSENKEPIIRILSELMQKNTEQEFPDVIVLPEAALPFLFQDESLLFSIMTSRIPKETHIIFGNLRYDEQFKWYNSIYSINRDEGRIDLEIYDKHKLVILGEYVPLFSLLKKLRLTDFFGIDGNIESSKRDYHDDILEVSDSVRIRPAICYEAVFPEFFRLPKQYDIILQITNDAWFGRSRGPLQHFSYVRARAIEQGVSLVRVANTGISGVINRKGRVLAILPLGERGVIDMDVPYGAPRTIYSKIGNMLFFVCLFSSFINLKWSSRRSTQYK